MSSAKERNLIKEFIRYLDLTDVSDSGKEFHPIQVTCCRASMIEPLSKCLNKMREIAYK